MHDMAEERSAELMRRGARELALPDSRLAPHEQRTPRRKGCPDRPDAFVVEKMVGRRPGLGGG